MSGAVIGEFYKDEAKAIRRAKEKERDVEKKFVVITAPNLNGYLVVSERQLR